MREIALRVEVDEKIEVLVDENFWTEKEIEEWSDVFYDADSVEDIAKHVLEGVIGCGRSSFIEGFGHIKIDGEYPYGVDEQEKCTTIEITGLDIRYEVDVD